MVTGDIALRQMMLRERSGCCVVTAVVGVMFGHGALVVVGAHCVGDGWVTDGDLTVHVICGSDHGIG